MLASLPAVLLLALQVQPAPQQPAPPAPPLFQPQERPRTPMQPPRVVGPRPCMNFTMRVIPADPRIDPKFAKPAPDPGTKYSGQVITPPPTCR